jgi:glc operon protein GlcG
MIFKSIYKKVTMKKNRNLFNLLFILLIFTYCNAEELKGENMIINKSVLSLKGAKSYIHAAQKIATKKDLSLSIAVVDSSGNLLAFSRMDNASLVTIDVAIQKAKTAALLKAPSKLFEDKINSGEISMLSVPNITPLQGGIPIFYKGELCGAVGISGASGDIDNSVALETIEAVKFEKE